MLFAPLWCQVLALQQDVAAATAAADTQALTARTAIARAEAAEQRLKQIEREADNMASMVGALQASIHAHARALTRV